jgi:hypothetical protein
VGEKIKKFISSLKSEDIGPILIVLVFACFIGKTIIQIVGTSFWGNHKIGSFFEQSNYTAQYYVNLFPENSETKNYRLKADIESFVENDIDQDDRAHFWKEYHIVRVYFPNGGYISFGEQDNESLEIGKRINQTDNDGEGWGVELTGEMVR